MESKRSGSRGPSPKRDPSQGRPGSAHSEGAVDQSDPAEYEFAMKMMHKPTLKRERAIRYDTAGEYDIIHNLEKVYLEIEIWT